MKIMIRCDLEGVTGIVNPAQVAPDSPEYPGALDMLHHDLNAVVDGLLATGRHEIWIYDMHMHGRNLDLARLDPHVRVVAGKPPYRPGNLGGLTSDFHGQILVGLHSKAGTDQLLHHTYEAQIRDLTLNSTSVGEVGMEAALAAELGVPTIMVTGDSAGCREARALLGPVVTVEVKESVGPTAGICFPTSDTGPRLSHGAQRSTEKVDEVALFRVRKPVTLGLTLENGAFADHVRGKLPTAAHAEGVLKIKADSVSAAWQKYLEAKP